MLVQVDTQSIAAELAGLDPLRVRHHTDPDSLRPLVADLDPTGRLPGFDPDRYHAIIAIQDSDPVRTITKTIATDHDRSGVAVVIIDALPDLDTTTLTFTSNGPLTVTHPALQDVRLTAAGLTAAGLTAAGLTAAGLTAAGLTAAGLTAEEAATCVAIVEATRGAQTQSMPQNDSSTDGMEALIDAAGALRPEFVNERPPSDQEPAGQNSLFARTD